MAKFIIEKTKKDYLDDIRGNIEPRKLRLLRKWDYWTGNFDPKKEFEGTVTNDSYLLRENQKMIRRSSPVLKAKIKELDNNKIEVDYRFSIDQEVLFMNAIYVGLIAGFIYKINMPNTAYIILLPLIVVFQLLGIWFGFLSSKKKYLDFIKRNNAA